MKTIKNYIYNVTYQMMVLIVPFVTTPYISRIFGPEGVGSYAVSYSIAHYFCLFGLLGINNYGTRTIAYCRDDDNKCKEAFWNLNYMRGITMGIACIAYALFVLFMVDSSKKILYMAQGGLLLASMADISWFFAGMEEFKKTAVRGIIVKLTGMILIFIFVRKKTDIWLYAGIIAGTMLIGQIAMWGAVGRRMKVAAPKSGLIRHYIWESFRFWIPAVAVNIYSSLDKVMLGYLISDSEAGIYENSQKTVKMVSTITTTFATVMTPKMSNYFITNNFKSLKDIVYKSFRFVTILAVPMSFGILSIRNTFVPWFYGEEFKKISLLLIISSWLVISLSWSNVLGNQILIPCGRETQYTKSVVIGACINICLNFFLIPEFKSMGAIISSVAAEYIGMFFMMYFARDMVQAKQLLIGIPKYFLVGGIMYIVIFYLGEMLGYYAYTTGIQIVSGIVIYGMGLYLIKDEFLSEQFKRLKGRGRDENKKNS